MDIVEEIKAKLSIVDVVSKYVSLKPSGSTFKACCPFHKERTPSFHVFPDRGRWHCYGACAVGGDIFTFIERIEHIDFKEAIKLLADWAGVIMPEHSEYQATNIIYELNDIAAKWYIDNLKGPALNYMLGRGFEKETLSRFQIGFSPAEGDKLYRYMKAKNYSEENLVKAGLIMKEKSGRIRDYFIARVIFPIKNESGRIIGFAGRTLDPKNKVKYINSQGSTVYSKKNVLWGIYEAKSAIRAEKALILVEGYTDVMMSHQHGYFNTVGLCGSSLTPEHLVVIKKYTRNLYLALDPDAAGEQATLRGIKIARKVFDGHTPAPEFLDGDDKVHGDLKIIELPNGMDPDVCIHDNPAEWQLRIIQARPVMDFLFDAVLSRLDLDRETGRASAADQLMPIINDLEDAVEKELYTVKLAKVIGVLPAVLRAKDYSRPITKAKQSVVSSISANANNGEEYCLSIILKYGDQSDMLPLMQMLTPSHFAKIENLEIFNLWRQDHLPPEDTHLKRHYEQLSKREMIVGPGTLKDCIDFLERRRRERECAELMRVYNELPYEEKKKLLNTVDEFRKPYGGHDAKEM